MALKNKLLIAAFVLALGAFAYFSNQKPAPQDGPPSLNLSVRSNNLSGSLQLERDIGCYLPGQPFTAQDLAAFEPPLGNPVNITAGIQLYHADRDLSVQDLYDSIVPVPDNKITLAHYSPTANPNHLFSMFPPMAGSNPFQPESIIPAHSAFFFISCKNTAAIGLKDSTMPASALPANFPPPAGEWMILPTPAVFDHRQYGLADFWPQKAANYASFADPANPQISAFPERAALDQPYDFAAATHKLAWIQGGAGAQPPNLAACNTNAPALEITSLREVQEMLYVIVREDNEVIILDDFDAENSDQTFSVFRKTYRPSEGIIKNRIIQSGGLHLFRKACQDQTEPIAVSRARQEYERLKFEQFPPEEPEISGEVVYDAPNVYNPGPIVARPIPRPDQEEGDDNAFVDGAVEYPDPTEVINGILDNSVIGGGLGNPGEELPEVGDNAADFNVYLPNYNFGGIGLNQNQSALPSLAEIAERNALAEEQTLVSDLAATESIIIALRAELKTMAKHLNFVLKNANDQDDFARATLSPKIAELKSAWETYWTTQDRLNSEFGYQRTLFTGADCVHDGNFGILTESDSILCTFENNRPKLLNAANIADNTIIENSFASNEFAINHSDIWIFVQLNENEQALLDLSERLATLNNTIRFINEAPRNAQGSWSVNFSYPLIESLPRQYSRILEDLNSINLANASQALVVGARELTVDIDQLLSDMLAIAAANDYNVCLNNNVDLMKEQANYNLCLHNAEFSALGAEVKRFSANLEILLRVAFEQAG